VVEKYCRKIADFSLCLHRSAVNQIRPNETDRWVRVMVDSGVLSLTGAVSSSDKIPVDILKKMV